MKSAKPVADLVPVRLADETATDDSAWLEELERRGVVRRATASLTEDYFTPVADGRRGPPASALLVAERGEGR